MSLTDGRHFKASEFACHDGTPYPEEWRDRWELLRDLCDAVRDIAGVPCQVISGYRTKTHNAELASKSESHQVASGSQHVDGRAGDLRATGMSASLFGIKLLQAYRAGKLPLLGGLGVYPVSNWVHVDTHKASDGHLRTWSGT